MTQLGKYDIIEELGRGGFGVVYKARDLSLERLVALKVLHPQLTVDPKFLERFRKEAQTLARINHPNVVTIHEIGEAEGKVYIAMEYLPGGSLADRLKQGPLSLEEALLTIGEVGEGLHAGHEEGLIHRDVKPGNILFNKRGEAVIADFGLAKALQISSSSVSSSVGGVGTAYYRAPELWLGDSPSPATDIYSLTCVFYEMLTGEILFDGNTPPMVMKKHFDPVNISGKLPPGAPSEYMNLLTRALSKDPGDRFATIKEFLYLANFYTENQSNKADIKREPTKNEKISKITTLSDAEIKRQTARYKIHPKNKVKNDKHQSHKPNPERKNSKLSTVWVVILIVSTFLVCLGCSILYFAPASWWCAITFNMLESCPVP
jgi:eukaryotic-like serine/threonine-protein kinase